MVQTEKATRNRRVDNAIAYAVERRWELAAKANRALLAGDPTDAEASNRLGKALTELGKPRLAIGAYRQALESDPTNTIARKNLERLEAEHAAARSAKKSAPAARTVKAKSRGAKLKQNGAAGPALSTHSLIDESGKSAEFTLLRPVPEAIASVTAGDAAALQPLPHGVSVAVNGAMLGQIEPRAGLRLKRMIEGGNEYAVVIRRAEGAEIVVYVRESRVDASLAGQASFLPPPAKPRRTTPRACTKASVVQHETQKADADDDEEDLWSPNEENELEASGFSNTAAGDSEEDEPGDDDENG